MEQIGLWAVDEILWLHIRLRDRRVRRVELNVVSKEKKLPGREREGSREVSRMTLSSLTRFTAERKN